MKNRMKKLMALALAGVMIFGNTITLQAATLKDVFDAQYYSDTYDDLKEAFGTNSRALYNHYVRFGNAEQRSMSELINVQMYREAYPDLDAAFGDDWDAYVNHYIEYGFNEGRNSFGTFDARAYADRYPDLKAAFGYDVIALYQHYMTYGRAEGRDASAVVVANHSSNSAGSAGSAGSSSDSSNTDTTTNTNPIATSGQLVDPETGAPVANATITFTLSSFNTLSEVADVTNETVDTEDVTEETADTEESTEETADTEESTEETADTEESTEETADTEGSTEETADTEESTEETADTEESTEETADTEESTEETADTEESTEENNGVVVGDGYYQVTTDENGYYEVPDFTPGVYSVVAEAPGYMSLTLNSISINSDAGSFTLPTFQMLSADMSGANTVSGTAVDATTGAGLNNVTLNIRGNWNNTTGDVVTSTVTDEAGNYSVELQRGYYTIEFVLEGYGSTFVNVASSNAVGPMNGVLNPNSTTNEVLSTEFRVVLTWGETPRDLDSHLVGPDDANGYFHVYFGDKNEYSESGELVASLDVDDVTSYGPETVTIVNARQDSTYYYSVHDFTNGGNASSTQMSASGANVKVYQGSVLVREYNVPLNQAGYIWNVFKIENGTVVDINSYNSTYSSMYGDYVNY